MADASITRPPAPITTPLTHFVPYDTPGLRTARALCGTYVERRDSTNEPTCDACKQRNAELDAMVF